VCPAAFLKNLEAFFTGKWIFVRPFAGQCIEDVGDRCNPALDGDIVSSQAERIPAAIPALMMRLRDATRHHEHRRAADMQNALSHPRMYFDRLKLLLREWFDNFFTQGSMAFHELKLLGIEFARFEQNRVRYADFADIMQLGRLFDERDLFFVPAELIGDNARELADAKNVIARLVVAVLSGSRQAEDQLLPRRARLASAT